MRRALLFLGLAACGSKVNPQYCAAHPGDHKYCAWLDSGIDSPPDGPTLCLGAATFAVCVAMPTAPVTLPSDIDTDLSTLCLAAQPAGWTANGQPDACFVVGTTIATAATTTAHGSRPLVLVASDTITVMTLDVASHRASPPVVGAGANPTACGSFAQAPTSAASIGGGGAGGTFYGAPGGAGASGASSLASGGTAMMPATTATTLRGGCAGQPGATGSAANGPSGAGGGAVYLLAQNQIDLTGAKINASGASAPASSAQSGGGGGGSGGMILIHAATIGASGATLIANGGGAAAGGSPGLGGNAGSDPSTTTPTTPASGGNGNGGASGGGAGFAGSTSASAGGIAASQGGGGGGGGGGFIGANHTLGTTNVSPAVTVM